MANWTIRKAVDGDAGAMSKCLLAAYSPYAARNLQLPSMTAADCLKDINNEQVWIAEVGPTLAGSLVLGPRDTYMQLANISVHPDHQGSGLGKALMKLAEAEALRQRYKEMRLATHIGMTENVSLYRHLGWQQTETVGDKISMRKSV